MKKLTLLVLVNLVVVSSCSTNTKNKPVKLKGQEPVSVEERTRQHMREIQQAVQQKMYLKDDFYGKRCDMKLKLSNNGSISDVTEVDGYQPLCNAALKAAKSAKMPTFPDGETYKRLKTLILTFRPGS